MKEKPLNLDEFARKVGAISAKRSLFSVDNRSKVKGIHLLTIEFSLGRKRGATTSAALLKNLKKMSMHEGESKTVPFLKTAYDAYKCCQNQDLHLMELQKIYLEKKFFLKGVVGWKLPKKKLVQQRIKELVEGCKFNPGAYKSHIVTWIAQAKKSEEEKSVQAQLELQKQQKDTRNYLSNKPIFR